MERLLLNRNADHLRQCTVDGTPFAIPPLNSLFGLYGVNEAADKLLQGTLDIEKLPLSEKATVWLYELRYEPGHSQPIDTSFTPDEFRRIT